LLFPDPGPTVVRPGGTCPFPCSLSGCDSACFWNGKGTLPTSHVLAARPRTAPAFRHAGADQVAFHVRSPPTTTIISRPVLSRVHSPVEFDDRDLDLVSSTYGLIGGACGLGAVVEMAAWAQLLPSLEARLSLPPRLAVRVPLPDPTASVRPEKAIPT
jgi:hypothetical protein